MWTRSKLGIVNLQQATQVYPWEPKPGVHEVRAVFPGGDTLTLSDHVSREAAAERVTQLLRQLGGKVETEWHLPPLANSEPSYVREDRNGKLHFDDAADAAWRAKQAK